MTTQGSAAIGSDFSIQQVSRLTGLSEPTLRYYEKVGLIDRVERDGSSRHRRYHQQAVDRISSLANLRAVGMGIEDMRTLMHSRGHAPETIDIKLGLLAAHRDETALQMKRLRARQRFLDNRIAYWKAVQRGDDAEAARIAEDGDRLAQHLQ